MGIDAHIPLWVLLDVYTTPGEATLGSRVSVHRSSPTYTHQELEVPLVTETRQAGRQQEGALVWGGHPHPRRAETFPVVSQKLLHQSQP